ncbi:MAG: LacI family transcriptional regulator, repressor for deo operon, udp, cdd, tsx, nupC, and nupG [Actinomycetota bacterium]|nr:LacI family transcriptional regulator, repressor for deo operon, udp, cdd, tsx, nupC, and nupG [Actinomycetota bacterium]
MVSPSPDPFRPQGSRPTGHDVARLAGVSQATVSLVFSGRSGRRVSEATRERVRQAAHELGYQPQATARQLRLGRTGLLLLTVPDIRGPFFARVLASAHDAAQSRGLTIVVSSNWNGETLSRITLAHQFDGLLVCSPRDCQVSRLPPHVPVVLLDSDPQLMAPGRGVLPLDVADGMRQAVRHLIELGHDRIGHLRYSRASHTFRVRQAAFEEETRGLQVTERSVGEGEGVEITRVAAQELLGTPDRPDAVICDDDVAAAGIYHAAFELGLRIPEDLSVVGIDNLDTAMFFTPSLTTVDLPGEELGRRGVEALAALLRGEESRPLSTVETQLVVRRSTAVPSRSRT